MAEVLDMSLIQDRDWALNLRKYLHSFTDEYLLNWCKVVIQLGEGEVELDKWIDIFQTSVEERYKELVSDVTNMKVKTLDRITELLNKIENNSKELGIKEDVSDINENENFYIIVKELTKRSERLENMLVERRKHVDILIKEQEKLCKILEKTTMQLTQPPKIPTPEETNQLQAYIEELNQEKYEREERFMKLSEEILNIARVLEVPPKTDFERQIFAEFHTDVNITESNMMRLTDLHSDMKQQLSRVQEEADSLRESIESMWTVLEESMEYKESFNTKNSGYSLTTVQALRAELKRCEAIKKANIKIFIDKMRSELRILWEKCYHENAENLENYPWFTSDFYTEDLLTFHEMEINKWKRFYSENENLIKLFTEHLKLWNSLLDMENKDSAGLNRYKNRGGQLLKEEKERNHLSKKIPQIEKRLRQLAEDYEELHGAPFLVFGTPIVEYIDNLHVQREQERKLKLSARKLTRDIDPNTPAKSCTTLFPSVSKVNFTPQPPSAMKRKLPKAVTTTKKRKSNGSNKKLNLSSADPISNCRAKRLSFEKKKRLIKCRKFLQKKSNKENIDDSNITNYDAFESGVFSLRSAHSSMYNGGVKM